VGKIRNHHGHDESPDTIAQTEISLEGLEDYPPYNIGSEHYKR